MSLPVWNSRLVGTAHPTQRIASSVFSISAPRNNPCTALFSPSPASHALLLAGCLAPTGVAVPPLKLKASADIGGEFLNAIAVSNDGRTIATAGGDSAPLLGGAASLRQVRLWDATTLGMTAKLDADTMEGGTYVDGVAFSGDGKWLAWSAVNGGISLSGKKGGTVLREFSGKDYREWQIQGHHPIFSLDSTLLATEERIASGYVIHITDIMSKKTRTLQIADNTISYGVGAQFAGSNGYLLVHVDDTARLISPADGKTIADLPKHAKYIKEVAVSARGQFVATLDQDDTILIWDTMGLKTVRSFEQSLAGKIGFSPDGSLLAVTGGGIKVWDIKSGKPLYEHADGRSISCFVFSPSGKQIFASGITFEGTRQLWVFDLR